MKTIRCLIACLLLFHALYLQPTLAQAQGLSLIRDAEIEGTIRAFSTPVFQAAGLEPSNIRIFLVNDRSLNAFVAGGQNLFINTGLLMKTKTPGEVIGVIAHETGHMAGGHLVRTQNALKKSTPLQILAAILGGAVIAAGGGAGGGAVIAGGGSAAQRNFLAYSRTQESSADQAALGFLEYTGQTAQGLVDFLEKIADQELLSSHRQDPYMRSHPVTRDRITRLEEGVRKSPYYQAPPSEDFVLRHKRMVAKLRGFIDPIAATLSHYKEDDQSLESRYARAIAYYRRPDLKKALPLIDSLIADYPNDPYFYELKGQMLRENGRVQEALEPYQQAVSLQGTSALLRTALAQTQLDMGDTALIKPAIDNLRTAISYERDTPFTWKLLAIGYGRHGDIGMNALAMAEYNFLTGNNREAIYHAGKAAKILKEKTSAWYQAQDILHELQKDLKQEENGDKG